MVSYKYDTWGKLLEISGPLASTVGVKNPYRYRGYRYDEETGLYSLQSRYYDPEIGRFINADGYVSTGQGLNGTNMFAYCENNPVMRADPSGQFWGEIWNFAKEAVNQIGQAFKAAAPVYAGMGAGTFADGPLPFADAAMLIGAAVLTVGVIGYGTYQATKSISIPKSTTKDKTKDIAPTLPEDTVVYRWPDRGTLNVSYTPSIRDLQFPNYGLSFSTIPKPGSAMTTIGALNATGIVFAVPDSLNHVSVYPVGGTLADWYAAGPNSPWSLAVESVCVKWDGN